MTSAPHLMPPTCRPGLPGHFLPCCRPYLRQRTHSAVCYLNSAGSDFQGGTFQFQQQEESGATSITSVHAAPGRVVNALIGCLNKPKI
jgi:hypothetical protein